MLAKRMRVLVCGSTFGQFYLEALKGRPDFEVVGLLATGSERSLNCAHNYGVPLFRSIEELPVNGVDIACVVVRSSVLGGEGSNLALSLLKRGIHVLQEHPSHPGNLEQCYKMANKHKVKYRTGSLYTFLPEVKKFVRCAKVLNEKSPPLQVSVELASQVFYPVVEILMQAMPSIRGWKLECSHRSTGPFQLLAGMLGGIPITLQVHNQVNPDDPNNQMLMLHKVTFLYSFGRLVLEDTFGPALWIPRMFTPISSSKRGNLKGDYPAYMRENASEVLPEYRPVSFENVFTEVWPQAIYEDITAFYQEILGESNYGKRVQSELLCAKQWSEMTKDMGYPEIVKEEPYCPILVETLQKVCYGLF